MENRIIHLDIAFCGRMGRRAFWLSFLLLFALLTVGIIAGGLLCELADSQNMPLMNHAGLGVMIASVAWYFITMLGLGARRLHDTGKSAWWLLLLFANVISGLGHLILFVLWAQPTQPGENRWGSGS